VAWIAAAARPGTGYLALVTPMIIIGAGFALAIPALTRSVTSTVPPADIGTASGAFTTMRQLGGAFGVALLGAAFAATGGYATPAAFSHGFTTAFAVAAGLALAGTAAGTMLPRRANRHHPPRRPSLAGRSAPAGQLPRGIPQRRTRTSGQQCAHRLNCALPCTESASY
jgi:MFS family permease